MSEITEDGSVASLLDWLKTTEGKIAAATCVVGCIVAVAQLGLAIVSGTLGDPKTGLPHITFPNRDEPSDELEEEEP